MVDHPLPKGWNSSNNLLTGRSLPEADIAALLAAVHGATKTGEITRHLLFFFNSHKLHDYITALQMNAGNAGT